MTKKLNVLHADDSRAIILYTKIMLMEVPVINTIETAGTVVQAKTALLRKKTDVAIFDINLPGGNGIQLAEWTKKNFPHITIIMFSNNSNEFFRSAAKKAGADYFLDKSMEFENIIKILKTL